MHQNHHISANLEPSTGSPQSTLWQEPLLSHSFLESTYNVVGMFEKMKIHQRGNNKYQTGYRTQSLNTSNVGPSSYQSLIHEQIRAIQLSRLKQDQVLFLKHKLAAYRGMEYCHGQIQHQYLYEYEPNEQILQFQKKGRGAGVESGPTRHGPLHQQAGSEIRALFLDGSGSRGASCGTGVFLPRCGTSVPSKKQQGKGCSAVLIPDRVVQALQLHFDQIAATSGPKAACFPPLHDVLVGYRHGMYSLQKRQSRKSMANIQNEMILPREWTY